MSHVNLLRVVLLASLSLACGDGTGAPHTPPTDTTSVTPITPSPTTPTLTRTVVMSGLSGPWDIAFTPDGAMLFTEKCRGLSVRHADGRISRVFGTNGSALVAPDLSCEGQSGVHGIAVDPAFATNRLVYVYMASTLNNPRTNRVVRLVLSSDNTSASGRTDIITDIPFKHTSNAVGGAGAHSGGRVRFGPDGFLYVTTGDNHNQELPQSGRLLGGKVLRVRTDGSAAPGNAPPAGYDARIYTYGHRNVQGITFRPGSGQPYSAEHGPNHSDEVTPLVNGGNAGWDPKERSGLSCPGGYCGYAGSATTMPMTDVARFPNAMRSAWTNNGASQGMGPALFLEGAMWGAWNGRLAVGIMAAPRLMILELDAAGAVVNTIEASLPRDRVRALTRGPAGELYIATDGGEIVRVVATTP